MVSARAIKHVRELTAIAAGERREPGVSLRAALLFVVIRNRRRVDSDTATATATATATPIATATATTHRHRHSLANIARPTMPC